jgi:hypothetical protein
VGIGTTSPAWGSPFSGTTVSLGAYGALAQASTGSLSIVENAYNNGTNWIYRNTGDNALRYVQGSGAHRWEYAASGTAGNTATFTEAMRINSSGNVGIGTTSPSAFGGYKTLAIGGDSGSSTSGVLQFISNGTEGLRIVEGSTAVEIIENRNIAMTLGTNATERMRIDSGGSLLVGTTNSNSNTFKFKVQAATDVCLGIASGTTVSGALTFNAVNDANSSNVPLDFRATAIYASNGIGTTGSAANAYFNSGGNNQFLRSTSALKYKTDIRDLESIDILKFRPVRYKSLCEADDKTKDHFGVIADEVHAAGIKELVTYGVGEEIEGFQYERLTVVLLKSLQELKAINDTQAETINALTARIVALEVK